MRHKSATRRRKSDFFIMNSDEMYLARFFMKNSRCYVNYGLGIRIISQFPKRNNKAKTSLLRLFHQLGRSIRKVSHGILVRIHNISP